LGVRGSVAHLQYEGMRTSNTPRLLVEHQSLISNDKSIADSFQFRIVCNLFVDRLHCLGNGAGFISPNIESGVHMFRRINSYLLLGVVAVMMAACGGGGGDAEASDEHKYPSLIAGTSGTATYDQATGSYNVYSEKDFQVNCLGYCDISIEPVNATRSDSGQHVTGYTAYHVVLKIDDATKPASAVIKATSTSDPKYARTFKVNILPSVAEALPVKINGTVAVADANGEYKIQSGTRITIGDSQNRLASNSTKTVDSSGNPASTTMNPHSLNGSTYDATFSSGPIGGLTTITFSAFDPDVVIKLRWE
jgi:hypothetical protein